MAENAFKADWPSFALGFNTGKSKGGGGTPEGLHMVRFFNDDLTTLLYTVFVPDGSSAMYAGETPASTVDDMFVFEGFQPAATNVTADMDCFAVYSEQTKTLDQTSWAKISELSADGTAQNYFAVGDAKTIHIEGLVGTVAVNVDYGVYIIGFDHNEELEGKGIHFGTFYKYTPTSSFYYRCIDDETYNTKIIDGTKCFNMNHWGGSSYDRTNYGGWAGCDMRYDILGSTDVAPSNYGAAASSGRTGYDATKNCATNPVAGTLMAALPADLRAVMKPMTKYTDNKGGKNNVETSVSATIDYLPLLAEFEIAGAKNAANQYEKNYQKQYDFYAAGNSKHKVGTLKNATLAYWDRSPCHISAAEFCYVNESGGAAQYKSSYFSFGIAPIFKV